MPAPGRTSAAAGRFGVTVVPVDVVLVLTLVLVALGIGGCTSAPETSRDGATTVGVATAPVPSTSAPAAPTADPVAEVRGSVAGLVSRRAAAVAAKDKAAWLASVRDPSDEFGRGQAALFDRLMALPVTGMAATGIDIAAAPTASTGPSTGVSTGPSTGATTGPSAGSSGGPSTAPGTAPAAASATSVAAPRQAPASTWVANLRLAYRFAGYDRGDRGFSVSYLVAPTPGGWRLSAPGPGRTDVQPFDLPNVRSAASPDTLVVGDVPAETLRMYVALGDTAHERIAKVWGRALPGVIVAPATLAELTAQLGRTGSGGLDQIAGVTDGPIPAHQPAPADRVYLNPDAFARLTGVGRQVVVTHELTHLTVRGTTTRPVPMWLSEGFADDVALATVGLPASTIAADLVAKVRAGSGPKALPGAADFDPATSTVAPAYNAAWLAVARMRQRYGQQKVVDFYRSVAGGPTADPGVTGSPDDLAAQAFRTVLGTGKEAFVADWLEYLQQLSR